VAKVQDLSLSIDGKTAHTTFSYKKKKGFEDNLQSVGPEPAGPVDGGLVGMEDGWRGEMDIWLFERRNHCGVSRVGADPIKMLWFLLLP
jgi:hypothetical protein